MLTESDPALMGARAQEVQQAAAEVQAPAGPQPVPSSRHKTERSKGTGDMDDMTSQKFYATFHGSIDDGYRLDNLRDEADYDMQDFEEGSGKPAADDDLALNTLDSESGLRPAGDPGGDRPARIWVTPRR